MNTPPTGLLKMALKNHWNGALKNKSCVSLQKYRISAKPQNEPNQKSGRKRKRRVLLF
jgi:hypothetical protein